MSGVYGQETADTIQEDLISESKAYHGFLFPLEFIIYSHPLSKSVCQKRADLYSHVDRDNVACG
jgi:hypothetical protein